jgi:hypothetical protein
MASPLRHLPTILELLPLIAPEGFVQSEENAAADTAALLRKQGFPSTAADTVSRQVRKFCQDHGTWSVVDGRRCLRLGSGDNRREARGPD